MATLAASFQNPRNNGSMAAGFALLVVFSELLARSVLPCNLLLSALADQFVQALPVGSLFEILVCQLPAGAHLVGLCPWLRLFETAARVGCQAF